MKLAIFSVLMIFAVSGYAALDCESEEYSYNKTVKELCEQQNEKLAAKKKQSLERFNERLQNRPLQGILNPSQPSTQPVTTPAAPAVSSTPSQTPPAAPSGNSTKYY